MADFYRLFLPKTMRCLEACAGRWSRSPRGRGVGMSSWSLTATQELELLRRKWHSGFASKRDADRGLARLLASRDDGMYISPQRLTVGAFLTYTDHLTPPSTATSSVSSSAAIRRRVFPATSRGRTVASIRLACPVVMSFFACPGSSFRQQGLQPVNGLYPPTAQRLSPVDQHPQRLQLTVHLQHP